MCIDGIGGKSAGFGAPEIVTGGKDGNCNCFCGLLIYI